MPKGQFEASFGVFQSHAPSADLFNGDPTGDYACLKYGFQIVFIIQEGAGGTGRATLTVLAATNASGGSAEAVPFRYISQANTGASRAAIAAATAAGITPAAGANKITMIVVNADELPDGKPWVALKATESVDDPVVGSIIGMVGPTRHQQDQIPAVTA